MDCWIWGWGGLTWSKLVAGLRLVSHSTKAWFIMVNFLKSSSCWVIAWGMDSDMACLLGKNKAFWQNPFCAWQPAPQNFGPKMVSPPSTVETKQDWSDDQCCGANTKKVWWFGFCCFLCLAELAVMLLPQVKQFLTAPLSMIHHQAQNVGWMGKMSHSPWFSSHALHQSLASCKQWNMLIWPVTPCHWKPMEDRVQGKEVEPWTSDVFSSLTKQSKEMLQWSTVMLMTWLVTSMTSQFKATSVRNLGMLSWVSMCSTFGMLWARKALWGIGALSVLSFWGCNFPHAQPKNSKVVQNICSKCILAGVCWRASEDLWRVNLKIHVLRLRRPDNAGKRTILVRWNLKFCILA